jgi:hypothetical protein
MENTNNSTTITKENEHAHTYQNVQKKKELIQKVLFTIRFTENFFFSCNVFSFFIFLQKKVPIMNK